MQGDDLWESEGGSQVPWLCFLMDNGGYWNTAVILLYSVSAPVAEFGYIIC